MLRVFTGFSGICTAEVGIRKAMPASEFVGRSEIDKYAEAIAKYHFPHVKNYGDATKIIPSELPDFEFCVFGFPCQSFSIAGKRQGFNEARGTLFFEIARILSHKRPGHILLENVEGLRSHESGETLQEILRILSDLNYRVETVVLNSKHHGVPQNRERVFFIGHLGSECSGEILSFGQSNGLFNGQSRDESGNTVCSTIRPGMSGIPGNSETYIVAKDGTPKNKDYASMLTGGGHSGGNHSDMDLIAVGTLRTHKDRNGKKTDGDCSFAVDTVNTGGVKVNKRIRRLTEIECERLQGLEDGFTQYGIFDGEVKEISSTQRYKTLGNGMTVDVIEAIVSRMIEKGCLGC